MASEASAAAPEPINDQIDFEGIIPQNTAYVKWDVKKGGDREHNPRIGVLYQLDGQPNIQGITIRSSVDVKVSCWTDSWDNGILNIVVEGPTGDKRKIDPARRLGSYRVDLR
ncbi:hypothetical protein V8C37DRAFT_403318 [Trichoderma ceciliae]